MAKTGTAYGAGASIAWEYHFHGEFIFGNKSRLLDAITDDVPDWSTDGVGYFRIVGNRRCLILKKEPGGWRLLPTGKRITNPGRLHFLREEIARMAGMTSGTLWEPQEAGEGSLGVPG